MIFIETTIVQWGWEYQTHLEFEGCSIFQQLTKCPPFCSVLQWFGSLENPLNEVETFRYINCPGLAKILVFQWSLPLENRTKWQPSCICTIGKPNFTTFSFPMCSVLEPSLYTLNLQFRTL